MQLLRAEARAGCYSARAVREEEVVGTQDRRALLRDLARSLLTTFDARSLAAAALAHLRGVVAVDAAVVLVPSESEDGIVVLAGDMLPGLPDRASWSMLTPATACGGVLSPFVWSREGALAGAEADGAAGVPPAGLVAALAAAGACAAAVVPLCARGSCEALLLALRREGSRFTPADLAALEDVAGPLSLALDNARLHRRLAQSFASLRTAEEEKARRERLAAIGTMAAVLAHEVRTPISVLYNAVATLRRLGVERTAGVEGAEVLRIVEDEARRLESLVDDLLEFGRPPSRSFIEVDPWELASSAVDAVRQTPAGRLVSIELQPRRERLRAVWDAHGVRQALLNLVDNAAQAAAARSDRPGHVRVRVAPEPDGRVLMVVADDGPGIPMELRARMFEPFVSARPRGIGLGLAVVRRVVDDHQGELLVDSTVGGGATFSMVLPTGGAVLPVPSPAR
jgi:signal transduction histidine kinase